MAIVKQRPRAIPKHHGLFCLALLACAACGESTVGEPSSQPGQPLLTATLADRTLTSVFPATLAIDPMRSVHQLSVTVGQGNDTWWFSADVLEQALVARSGSVPIGGQAAGLGRGPALRANSGSLNLQLANQRISGSAITDSKALDASFVGTLAVSCLVPRSLLSNAPERTVGDGEAKVEDALFETSLCARYKALAGK
jgi:hypothetical protein